MSVSQFASPRHLPSTRRPIYVRHLPTAGRLSNDLASAPLRLYTKADRGLLPAGLLRRPPRAARPAVWRRWRRPGPSVRSPPLTPVPGLPHPGGFYTSSSHLHSHPSLGLSSQMLSPDSIPISGSRPQAPANTLPALAQAAAGEQP
jgi:hypothetical protein